MKRDFILRKAAIFDDFELTLTHDNLFGFPLGVFFRKFRQILQIHYITNIVMTRVFNGKNKFWNENFIFSRHHDQALDLTRHVNACPSWSSCVTDWSTRSLIPNARRSLTKGSSKLMERSALTRPTQLASWVSWNSYFKFHNIDLGWLRNLDWNVIGVMWFGNKNIIFGSRMIYSNNLRFTELIQSLSEWW